MLTERDDGLYGESQADIRESLERYGSDNYPPTAFADAVCTCGGKTFQLEVDDELGVAIRTCTGCDKPHPIADSGEFLEDAIVDACECLCDAKTFEVTVGLALYDDSEDVRWLYLGARCTKCGLTGCYGDWKNEFTGYRELLSRV